MQASGVCLRLMQCMRIRLSQDDAPPCPFFPLLLLRLAPDRRKTCIGMHAASTVAPAQGGPRGAVREWNWCIAERGAKKREKLECRRAHAGSFGSEVHLGSAPSMFMFPMCHHHPCPCPTSPHRGFSLGLCPHHQCWSAVWPVLGKPCMQRWGYRRWDVRVRELRQRSVTEWDDPEVPNWAGRGQGTTDGHVILARNAGTNQKAAATPCDFSAIDHRPHAAISPPCAWVLTRTQNRHAAFLLATDLWKWKKTSLGVCREQVAGTQAMVGLVHEKQGGMFAGTPPIGATIRMKRQRFCEAAGKKRKSTGFGEQISAGRQSKRGGIRLQPGGEVVECAVSGSTSTCFGAGLCDLRPDRRGENCVSLRVPARSLRLSNAAARYRQRTGHSCSHTV